MGDPKESEKIAPIIRHQSEDSKKQRRWMVVGCVYQKVDCTSGIPLRTKGGDGTIG